MQMEEPAQRIGRLVRDLCPDEPLSKKCRFTSGIVAFTAVRDHSNKSECDKSGFYLYQGSSRRNGRFEKSGAQSIGRTRGGRNTKLHMVTASDRDGVIFSLSAGNCGDAPEGRALLQQLGPAEHPVYLLMDRAYEGDETRALAVELGYIPVVPPKSNRKNPWATVPSRLTLCITSLVCSPRPRPRKKRRSLSTTPLLPDKNTSL